MRLSMTKHLGAILVLLVSLMGRAVSASTPDSASSFDVTIVVRSAASALPEKASVELAAVDAEEVPSVKTTVPLEAGRGSVTVPVDTRWKWRVEASAEGFWSPATVVAPGSADAPSVVPISLWPAAELEGIIAQPTGTSPVAKLRIRFAPSPATKQAAPGQPEGTFWVTCPVSREQKIEQCSGPAGAWNLRLDAASFSPLFIWAVQATPGEMLDLGRVVLKPGGALSGRVVTAVGPADPAKTTVELRPLFDPSTLNPERRQELAQLRRTAKVGTWGDFQFTGVAPGSYRLLAQEKGLSPAERSPVTVRRGEETRLEDPLVLEELLRLQALIEPAADPFDEPWTVQMHRTVDGNVMKQVASGPVDETGEWQSPPLAAGPYSLQVLDQRGNSLGWWDVQLDEASDLVSIDLPVVFVDGHVELGDEPLAAHLWFGGEHGEERIETTAEEDGSFYVVLPRDGNWTVDVEADDPPVTSRGLSVDVDPVEGMRTADVLIEVPNTTIEGEVVDEIGVPVQSARVLVQSYGAWQGVVPTDTDLVGRFEVRGMRPGQFSIEATSDEGRSQPVIRQVDEDQTVSVQLMIQKERSMVGRVVSESGPVAAARVLAVAFTSSGQPASMRIAEGTTDVEGRFEISVPGGSALVRLVVMAPGYALYLGTAREGTRLEIPLSHDAGTLHLGAVDPGAGIVGLLVADGGAVSTARLQTWAVMNNAPVAAGEELTVPAMPPGSYAYCELSVQEALLVLGGVGAPRTEACSQGFLSQGGELTLDPHS